MRRFLYYLYNFSSFFMYSLSIGLIWINYGANPTTITIVILFVISFLMEGNQGYIKRKLLDK